MATDIIARGIDIPDVDVVINFDVPRDAEDYVHRIGRTARAQSKGEAFTLIVPDEMYSFGRIEKLIEQNVEKLPLPEGLGEQPKYDPNTRIRGGGHGAQGGNRKGGNAGNRSGGNRPGNGSGQRSGNRGPRRPRPQGEGDTAARQQRPQGDGQQKRHSHHNGGHRRGPRPEGGQPSAPTGGNE